MDSISMRLSTIVENALSLIVPECCEKIECFPGKEGKNQRDYYSPSLIEIFSKLKDELQSNNNGVITCLDFANAVKEQILKYCELPNFENKIIEEIETIEQGNQVFLNITVSGCFIEQEINKLAAVTGNVYCEHNNNNANGKESSELIIVDMSSPNIAKNMHVGHLRSTLEGEFAARILEYEGHTVKRINHIGDWGTQFGMLITELLDKYPGFLQETHPSLEMAIDDLESFYVSAKKRFDEEDFKQRARETVVKLEGGDKLCLAAWKMFCDISRAEFEKVYEELNIQIEEVGESFYNPMLPEIVEDLLDRKIAKTDEGAICIFLPNKLQPLIIQKSDGGFNYNTTDLAAMKYRFEQLGANRIIIATDMGQNEHFEQIFEAGELCKYYDKKEVEFDHMGFGIVLLKKEKISTREGNTVKLIDLINEGYERTLEIFAERHEESQNSIHLSEEQWPAAAKILSISAIKYFEYNRDRKTEYEFNFDKMLDPKGNTGVYIIYEYARICSILEKSSCTSTNDLFVLTHDAERSLALSLLKLPDQINTATEELEPVRICELLYEIATKFSSFYKECKILNLADEGCEWSRIILVEVTRKCMKELLDLLGMEVLEEM